MSSQGAKNGAGGKGCDRHCDGKSCEALGRLCLDIVLGEPINRFAGLSLCCPIDVNCQKHLGHQFCDPGRLGRAKDHLEADGDADGNKTGSHPGGKCSLSGQKRAVFGPFGKITGVVVGMICHVSLSITMRLRKMFELRRARVSAHPHWISTKRCSALARAALWFRPNRSA